MLDNAIRDRAGASEVHAPTVIGAYVARCLVARAVEAPVTARAGIIPTNGDQVCAWVGVPSAMAGDRRPEGQPHQVMGEIAPDWATAWPPARGTAPVRGFAGLPGYLRRPWGQGWALIGDAGYFKGPLTAHGMTETLRAELLACAHVAGAGDPAALDVALAGYAATRDLLSLPLFRLTAGSHLRLVDAQSARTAPGHQRRHARGDRLPRTSSTSTTSTRCRQPVEQT